ncbi:MAG: hypothetical protein A2X81_20520 [Desulfobacterales bacterium GWB2_56_26]|nr:MAG: hypothetical protein A2X81_20520 [Desulfobacterales bacterium GWB2_56_26]
MNSHPTQTYFRPGADLRLRQQVYRRNVFIDTKIWPRIRNMLFILCSILLAANLVLSHIVANLEQALQTEENVRHELTETQISLRATRDQIYSPDHILMLASQKLSLQIPEREQVKVYQ